jgi:hypothetical protein
LVAASALRDAPADFFRVLFLLVFDAGDAVRAVSLAVAVEAPGADVAVARAFEVFFAAAPVRLAVLATREAADERAAVVDAFRFAAPPLSLVPDLVVVRLATDEPRLCVPPVATVDRQNKEIHEKRIFQL